MALAALKENATSEEIAQRFGIHVTQVHKWKKELTDSAELVFGSKKHNFEEKEVELHAQIGKLAVEKDTVIVNQLEVRKEKIPCGTWNLNEQGVESLNFGYFWSRHWGPP